MDSPTTAEERFLTPQDLADRYRVTIRTIRTWNRDGTGPKYLKTGDERTNKVLYRLSDVLAWEATRIRGGEVA